VNEPACGFTAAPHRPIFYRYRVATPGLRLARNYYRGQGHSAFIGVALVAGRYAYCIKWADAKVHLPRTP
jgi:hypothetical protein